MWQNIVVELLILGFILKRHCSQRVRYPKTHVLHGQGCKPAPSFLFLIHLKAFRLYVVSITKESLQKRKEKLC